MMRRKLSENFRCLFLDSAQMVVGMRSHMAAAGINVMSAVANGSLVLSSERNYLIGGRRFDVDRMISGLASTLQKALDSGFDGLWASGNIGWELGPERDFSQLLEYEWQLDSFLRDHPQLSGVCQYHRDSLPREAIVDGVLSHSTVFVDQATSLKNPHAVCRERFQPASRENPEIGGFVQHVCRLTPWNRESAPAPAAAY